MVRPRSLPLWLPVPEYAGFLSRDVTPSLAAGLRPRPLGTTVRDTADWLAAVDAGSGPGTGRRIGLTEDEEAELLAAWTPLTAPSRPPGSRRPLDRPLAAPSRPPGSRPLDRPVAGEFSTAR